MSDRAVFLDKDGTLIENVPYNVDPDKIRLLPGTETGLKALHEDGYKLVVVSNQSGIARGYFSEAQLERVERRLRALLANAGIPLLAFYYCPHHPEGAVTRYAVVCSCRKPAPGLFLQAAQDHDLCLSESWAIGDILDDIEAGRRAGCRTMLIDNGNETEWTLSPLRSPHYTVQDLEQAAHVILSGSPISDFEPAKSTAGGQR